MMKRFTKAHSTLITKALVECAQAASQLQDAVGEFNGVLEEARDKVQRHADIYAEKLDGLRGVYAEIGEDARNYYDERSETWQESDTGSAYSEWVDTLESPDIEDLALDFPDELEIELPDFTDTEWLPKEEPEDA
jgi:hypothetical protein